MFNKKSKKMLLFNIYANLIVGLLLAGTGIVLEITKSSMVENNKGFVALSFIPLALGLYSLCTLILMKKYPKKMKSVITEENDERLISIKNEADAITFRVLQWALMLVYFGYTFMMPKDIFEAPAWWITLAFFFSSFILQGILLSVFQRKEKINNNDN